jgi:ATP-dependent helicase HrpA
VVESTDRDLDVRAYPTLLDVGDGVALRVVTTPDLQQRAMRGGVVRLLLLDGAPRYESVDRLLTGSGRLALAGGDIDVSVLVDDCIAAAVENVIDDHLADHGSLPFTESEFVLLQSEVRRVGANRAGRALGKAVAIVSRANAINDRLADLIAPAAQPSVEDANAQLGRLVRPGFVSSAGLDRLDDIDRYVRAIAYRLDHLAGAIGRDEVRMAEVQPLERRYTSFIDRLPVADITTDIAGVRWLLEELRVSVFAEAIGATGGTSVKRVRHSLDRVGA